MRGRRAALASLLAGALLGGGARARAQLLSPGPLARDHQAIDGDTHCGECHSSGRRVSTERCNRCHQSVARTIRARTGLHGRQYADRSCGSCHVEHRGRSGRLVRWPGGSREAFDHSLVGWPLRLAHREVECRDCHDRRNSRGARTFLGASTACASCHRDPHDGRFGRRCTGCHSESAWDALDLDSFDHARSRFPLRGAHARVDCARCHGTPPRYRGLSFARCVDCHEDPHEGRLGAGCTDCHSVATWHQVESLRQRHPGSPLVGGHASVACADCHDVGLDRPPSHGDACVACHRPVHAAPLGSRCERCHRAVRWLGLPRRVGLLAHAQTDFPLRGAHGDTACAACHPSSRPVRRRYRGLPHERCASCHEDPHEGEFRARDGGECGGCHREAGFRPTTFTVAMHQTTSFPLEGAHAFVACAACHGAEAPRLHWTVEAGRQRCEGCHRDPHGGQFAAEMARGGCASCHVPAGWDRTEIDHSFWPLEGEHQGVPCERCHGSLAGEGDGDAGTRFRGRSTACASCHEDVHAGQFRLSPPRRECPACHDPSGFRIERFDHERIAGYRLEGRHARAPCSSCHRREALRGGLEAVRWRLGYRACRDCHADPHTGAAR